MPVEKLAVQQETELDRAIQKIHQDNTPLPFALGTNGKTTTSTRLELYNKLFSEEARLGYYKNYPNVSEARINLILQKGIILLARAKVIVHFPSIIDGELKKASPNTDIHQPAA